MGFNTSCSKSVCAVEMSNGIGKSDAWTKTEPAVQIWESLAYTQEGWVKQEKEQWA